MTADSAADPSRARMLRMARIAVHVITVTLLVVSAARAIVVGANTAAALAVAVLFLGVYAAGIVLGRGRGRGASAWLACLAALWAAGVVLSSEFVWLCVPLLLLAGHLFSLVWSLVFTAVVLAVAVAAPIVEGVAITPAHIIGPLVGGAFSLAVAIGYDALLRDAAERERLIVSLRTAQEETAALQHELARTHREAGAASERTRLSRDLHDTIAQELSSIVMLARTGDANQMPDIEQRAHHSLTDLRRIVAALAPQELEGSELSRALQRMVTALAAETTIIATSEIAQSLPRLSTPHEVVLLRVAQSALANVRQHAQASCVHLTLHADDDAVTMVVADDGRGFDPHAPPAKESSYGVAAMRARLREAGGSLHVDSRPDAGTRVVASLPAGEGA